MGAGSIVLFSTVFYDWNWGFFCHKRVEQISLFVYNFDDFFSQKLLKLCTRYNYRVFDVKLFSFFEVVYLKVKPTYVHKLYTLFVYIHVHILIHILKRKWMKTVYIYQRMRMRMVYKHFFFIWNAAVIISCILLAIII